MLILQDVIYRIAGRTLLDQACLSIPDGYRVGLVGLNGTGKSTLFKLIAGELEVDSGKITRAATTKLGMVRQDMPDDDTSLLDVVLAADTERAELFYRLETMADPMEMADIYERLEAIDAYNAPARAAIILSGLGFDQDAQAKPISDFSGGWRMRVALAAALFCQPDLLMLDEPTNHLDFEAIIWLEHYLASYTKTLIIISHDRDILNKTVTHIAHLDQRKLTMYTGNYDQFEVLRAQKLFNHQALFEKQQAQKKKMMAFVDRFRAKASKARQAQSRLKAIERMDMVDALIAERAISFRFPDPEALPPPMITLDEVDIGYEPGKPILKNLGLRIDMEDRIALLGANGNGKSTLIKLLSGTLQPMAGEMVRSSKLKVGYFAQHQAEELDMSSTAYHVLQDALPTTPEPKIRGILGRFNFDKQKADTRIAELSGGEKARLLFCLMSHHAPHIMLLDEPTNHLDMDAREALIQALNEYKGCVILVSHDPHLVECVADQLWLVKDGKCVPYHEDLEAYRTLIIQQRKAERSDAKKSARKGKEERSDSQAHAKRTSNLEKAEKELEEWLHEKDRIENLLASPSALNSPKHMSELLAAYEVVKAEIIKAEERWMNIQEV